MHIIFSDPSATLARLGIAVPAEVDAANAVAAKVSELAYTPPAEVLPGTTTVETVEDDFRRLMADRDLRRYAQEMSGHFDRAARDAVREVYRRKDIADRVLSDLQAAAKARLARITKAAKHLEPGDTAETVLERGDDAAAAWRKRDDLDEAASELHSIALTTAEVASLRAGRIGDVVLGDVPDPLWWIDAEDRNALDRLTAELWNTPGPGGGFLALIHAGHKPSLATPQQAAERLAGIRAKEQAEAERLRGAVLGGPMSARQARTQRAWLDALS